MKTLLRIAAFVAAPVGGVFAGELVRRWQTQCLLAPPEAAWRIGLVALGLGAIFILSAIPPRRAPWSILAAVAMFLGAAIAATGVAVPRCVPEETGIVFFLQHVSGIGAAILGAGRLLTEWIATTTARPRGLYDKSLHRN